ncbi:hypothetical protein [Puia sp.]|jgi:hypothetical protein|uniref:hypothetical protein n=1 Tax=Puia sp. TaxID=2045100 RepID=UPI002F3FD730
MKRNTLILFLIVASLGVKGQPILDQSIQIAIDRQPLGHALEIIGTTGRFTFSYEGTILNKDSLVTLPSQTKTVREILDHIFNHRLEYRENGRYLILLPATAKPPPPPTEPRHFTISGVILDESTGQKIPDASVYDPDRLIATLSRADGSFVIRLKSKGRPAALTISKEFYTDTTITLSPAAGQLTILLSPAFSPTPVTLSPQSISPDTISISWQADAAQVRTILKKDLVQVEMTGFGRILLSSRLKMQSLNLKKLFIQRPIQVSLVPRLSTNGPLNSQVTNKFSINLVGGYSAGLEGVELGGVFNIDRRKMVGFQAAGGVNIAGDTVVGVQMAGAYNRALDTVKGLQAAGAANTARNVQGVQLAGGVNFADHVNGSQLGVVNITRHLRGFQLGVINIADTSEGVSLGLFNFVKHGGIHELSLYANEFSPLNLAYRSGNKALYTIFSVGWNPDNDRRSYYYGLGLGHRCPLGKKLSLDIEASEAHLAPAALKSFGDGTWLHRLNIDLHWKITKVFALSAGPSMAIYTPDKDYFIQGHLYHPVTYSTFTFSGRNIGWIGWHAAIDFL